MACICLNCIFKLKPDSSRDVLPAHDLQHKFCIFVHKFILHRFPVLFLVPTFQLRWVGDLADKSMSRWMTHSQTIPCFSFFKGILSKVSFQQPRLPAGNAPCLATVMVSHHWRNLFCHLSAAVLAYALGQTSYEATAESPWATRDIRDWTDWNMEDRILASQTMSHGAK